MIPGGVSRLVTEVFRFKEKMAFQPWTRIPTSSSVETNMIVSPCIDGLSLRKTLGAPLLRSGSRSAIG